MLLSTYALGMWIPPIIFSKLLKLVFDVCRACVLDRFTLVESFSYVHYY